MRGMHEQWMTRQLQRLADAIGAHPWLFLFPQILLAVGCFAYSLANLRFSATRADLISDKVKYQRDFLNFKREFQVPDALVAVAESESPEKNRRFVERLASRLRQEPELFRETYFKGDLKMMGRKALLFLSEETLEQLQRTLDEEWPFIERFSKAETLDAVFQLVNRQFRESSEGQSDETELTRALPALSVLRRTLDEASASITQPLTNSFPGLAALFGDQSRLYLTFSAGQIYVVVTHAAGRQLEERAVVRLRRIVRETRDEVTGLNAGISGEPVLNYDEMVQAHRDIRLATLISIAAVALIFIFGFHEIARPALATFCLLVGITYSLGFSALTVRRLSILSITLVPILIGLAIDFGVHLISRYEEELRAGNPREVALRKALALTGMGIFTSGFTTAAAFFAMMLTDFKGIQEMGFISGVGLLLCLVPMMTLLPVLLMRGQDNRTKKKQPLSKRSFRGLVEEKWLQSPRLVMVSAVAFTVISVSQFHRLHFDYNLLHLQSSDLPAVGIEEKLMRTGDQSLLYGVVIADSLEQAAQLERRIKSLRPVSRVTSMVDYLTEDQTRKLGLIHQIKRRAESVKLAPPPVEPVDLASLDRTLFALQGYLGLTLEKLAHEERAQISRDEIESLRNSVARLRSLFNRAREETVSRLTAFQKTVFENLNETVELIRNQDDQQRLLVSDLPPFLREQFISPSGKFLLQVNPKADLWQRENQARFIEALRSVDPNVTGTVVQIYEFTSLIKGNFLRASAYSGIVIAIVLIIHFRQLSAVFLSFFPVALGLAWMLGIMGALGISFNPVNIMALTLLIGIGVTNGVHILNRFAEDPRPAIFSQSTGKAVLVSAFTTIAGFGSLTVAKHQGIASLGQIMAIGTGTCLIASLAVLPALLTLANRKKSREFTIGKSGMDRPILRVDRGKDH